MSSTRILVHAQAKLNLRLRVLARDTSGYHAVETIMHKIALHDDVDVALAPPGTRTIECDVDVGPPEHNLARRAADAFLANTSWHTGYTIRITKRIPAGGGLGGGSADAGATLRALNALAPSPLSPTALLALATPLGADVPFLTSDAAMVLAWGRGERMLSLDPLPTRYVALVLPDFRVPTADAYQWLAEHRIRQNTPPATAIALHHWHLANWSELMPWSGNDFEPVVAQHHPTIPAILTALTAAGASLAAMTGSGSTLFGIFDAPPNPTALHIATGHPIILTHTTAVSH